MSERTRTSLLILAGPLCSGKTTLAKALAEQTGALVVSARAELHKLGATGDRGDLQDFGTALERRTGGAWLASAVPSADEHPAPVIVDSARTLNQIRALRSIRQDVVVMYLTAPLEERRQRYERRDDPVDRGRSVESALSGEQEDVGELAAHADLQLETGNETPLDVLSRARRLVELRRV
jgi:cytidylate kinase